MIFVPYIFCVLLVGNGNTLHDVDKENHNNVQNAMINIVNEYIYASNGEHVNFEIYRKNMKETLQRLIFCHNLQNINDIKTIENIMSVHDIVYNNYINYITGRNSFHARNAIILLCVILQISEDLFYTVCEPLCKPVNSVSIDVRSNVAFQKWKDELIKLATCGKEVNKILLVNGYYEYF